MASTDSTDSTETWKKCSSCKKSIEFGATYYACSVSTCNGLRTGYIFCSVHCFERHLPGARHKDAAAIEKTAPAFAGTQSTEAPRTPARVLAVSKPTTSVSSGNSSGNSSGATVRRPTTPQEVLVIASRLKDYIQARSEFNTSGSVMDVLSEHLRVLCDRAIDNARAEGRKTVMDRDFNFLKSLR